VPYIGRFAPSPSGPLHAGSLVAALASWLDARAHGGRWLVRIEDIDGPRTMPGAAETISAQLAACGLVPDEAPVWQSSREPLYEAALQRLLSTGWAYPCGCSRRDLAEAAARNGLLPTRHAERVYPGTCRRGLLGKPARAIRVLSAPALDRPDAPLRIDWIDRRLGPQTQDVSNQVGDFVVRRADGLWAYQLAVVVDDAAQGITDVVRGADLADNTARQLQLQQALGVPTPRYLHTPLVLGMNGEKLSKQNGAREVDTGNPLHALNDAASALGLPRQAGGVESALAAWVVQWRATYN